MDWEYLIVGAIFIYFFRDILLDILDSIMKAISRERVRSKPSTFVDKRGYERFSDSGKSVHRWVAEKKQGRKLRPGEVVHHKNRNKLDNHPDNLHVFRNQAEHDRAHKIDAARFGKKASYKGFDHQDD